MTLTQPEIDDVMAQVRSKIPAGQLVGEIQKFDVDAEFTRPRERTVPRGGVVVWINHVAANPMRVELPDEVGKVVKFGDHAYVHVGSNAPDGEHRHWVYSGDHRTQAGSDPRIIIR